LSGFQTGFNAVLAAHHDNPEKRKPASEAGLRELRGKDSNLDYLIQSQASYH
jgi:hypothetical protein